jgi:peptide chain release factor 2
MRILKARLAERMREEQQTKLENLRGERRGIDFGSQIRSYVLAPYRLVKDHRTGVEVGDVDRVLDGDLDGFIEAELRRRAGDGSREW